MKKDPFPSFHDDGLNDRESLCGYAGWIHKTEKIHAQSLLIAAVNHLITNTL